jgi:hypothetical protein
MFVSFGPLNLTQTHPVLRPMMLMIRMVSVRRRIPSKS